MGKRKTLLRKLAVLLFGAALILTGCEQPVAGPGEEQVPDPLVLRSADAVLASLSLSAGNPVYPVPLAPEFSADVTEYSAVIDEAENAVIVNAAANHAGAAVVITGAQTLTAASNTVTITVTAEDGAAKQTYTVTVLRTRALVKGLAPSAGTLMPAFSQPVTEYTVFVENSVGVIAITPSLKQGAASTNNAATAQPLNEGSNIFTVSASDGTVTESYTVNVSRRNAAGAIVIKTREELAKIIVKRDEGWTRDESYALDANLVLDNWVPVARIPARSFQGKFDGNGHTITLNSFSAADTRSGEYLGVFGYVGGTASSKALIKNLSITANITTNNVQTAREQSIGLLAGCVTNAAIEGIRTSGVISLTTLSYTSLGGVAGQSIAGAVITGCENSADLFLDSSLGGNIGGILGLFDGGAETGNCKNTGEIILDCPRNSAQGYAGGIAGTCAGGDLADPSGSNTTGFKGWIHDCDNMGNVYSRAVGYWAYAAGIVGYISGSLTAGYPVPEVRTRVVRCHSAGIISNLGKDGAGAYGPFPYLGGITAYNYFGGLVAECYFDGTIEPADRPWKGAGLIAGYNSQNSQLGIVATVEDCYSPSTGPLVGLNTLVNNKVVRCYGFGGPVTQGNDDGGYNGGGIENCVIIATAGRPNVLVVEGSGIYRNNTVWTEAGKPLQAFYEGKNWDFTPGTGVWKMGADGYPHFQWEP